MSATVIGRGRGRGRGLTAKLSEQKPGLTEQKPGPTKLATQNEKTVSEIVTQMERMTVSEILKTIPGEVVMIKSEQNIEELVKLLCDKALKEPDFGSTAAQLCNELWKNNELHSLIRKPLLTEVQEKYTKRAELKKQRHDNFYGLCAFLCELYKHLRLKDLTLKPLVTPVCQVLKELLELNVNPSDEDILYFYEELESVGELIQQDNQEKVDEIINIARQTVISAELLPSIRCRLVQIIELHAANWTMSGEIKALYDDLQQDLMVEGR